MFQQMMGYTVPINFVTSPFVQRGCISSIKCQSCGVTLQCDSGTSKKQDTYNEDKTIYYIWGPCCCGMQNCPACKGWINGRDLFANIRYINNNSTAINPPLEDYQI